MLVGEKVEKPLNLTEGGVRGWTKAHATCPEESIMNSER